MATPVTPRARGGPMVGETKDASTSPTIAADGSGDGGGGEPPASWPSYALVRASSVARLVSGESARSGGGSVSSPRGVQGPPTAGLTVYVGPGSSPGSGTDPGAGVGNSSAGRGPAEADEAPTLSRANSTPGLTRTRLSVHVPRTANASPVDTPDQASKRSAAAVRRKWSLADRKSQALAFLFSIHIDRRGHGHTHVGMGERASRDVGRHSRANSMLTGYDRHLESGHPSAVSLKNLLVVRPAGELARLLLNRRIDLCVTSTATEDTLTAPSSGATTPHVPSTAGVGATLALAASAIAASAAARAAGQQPSSTSLFSQPIAIFSVLSRFAEAADVDSLSSDNVHAQEFASLVMHHRRTVRYVRHLSSSWVMPASSRARSRYTPDAIESPTLRATTERVVTALPSLRASVLAFVPAADLRAQVDEQFRLRHPLLHETLSLSAIRSIKRRMTAIAVCAGAEMSVVAFAFVYLETLLLSNKVPSAAVLPVIAASVLRLAHKFNSNLDGRLPLDAVIEEQLLVTKQQQVRAEFRVFALLEFGLHVDPAIVNVHYDRVVAMVGNRPARAGGSSLKVTAVTAAGVGAASGAEAGMPSDFTIPSSSSDS